jgi:hypothetical protein
MTRAVHLSLDQLAFILRIRPEPAMLFGALGSQNDAHYSLMARHLPFLRHSARGDSRCCLEN